MSAAKPIHWSESPKRRLAALLASGMFVALTACGTEDPAAAQATSSTPTEELTPPVPESEPGTLSFELRIAGDVTLNTFDYAIIGPDFSKAGSIDVTNSTTISARIDGIPAAAGYTVTLSGTSATAPKAQCSGSAPFDIQTRTVTNVPIAIACHLAPNVVTPQEPTPAPVPPFASWLFGLALLLVGSRFVSPHSRPKISL